MPVLLLMLKFCLYNDNNGEETGLLCMSHLSEMLTVRAHRITTLRCACAVIIALRACRLYEATRLKQSLHLAGSSRTHRTEHPVFRQLGYDKINASDA